MHPRTPLGRSCRSLWLLCALAALVSALSSCVVTSLTVAHYYRVSGGLDHRARATEAWRGPEGELAIALEDLEASYGRKDTVLVVKSDELEQLFAGAAPDKAPMIPVPHARLPRAILFRGLEVARPAPGSEAWVPCAAWDPGPEEVDGVARHVLPAALAEAPFAVHWTRAYRTPAGETGFALLLTRTGAAGVQHALLLPAAFEAPAWTNVLVLLAIAADVLWITLLVT